MARRAQRSFQRRSQRLAPGWAFSQSAILATIPAGTKAILATFALNTTNLGETILRTRGLLWVQSDQSVAFNEQQSGAFGGLVATSNAVAAGVASLPDPFTDGADDGWFVHRPFVQTSPSINGELGGQQGRLYEIDSKAMRKVETGYDLVFIIGNGGGFGMQVLFSIRLLSKPTQG